MMKKSTYKNTMKKLIVDADTLCYHSQDAVTLKLAKKYLDAKIERIKLKSGIDNLVFFLTEGKNFRYDLITDYKANRKNQKAPKFKAELSEYLKKKWKATSDTKWEADDLVVEEWKKDKENNFIASMDKDVIKNLPGKHFNLYKMDWITVSVKQAYENFYQQFITGDFIDNIPSIQKGLGPKTIQKLVKESGLKTSELAMYLCKIKNIDFYKRFRIIYCGITMPVVDFKDIPQNKVIDDYLAKVEANKNKPKKVKELVYDTKYYDFGRYSPLLNPETNKEAYNIITLTPYAFVLKYECGVKGLENYDPNIDYKRKYLSPNSSYLFKWNYKDYYDDELDLDDEPEID